MQLRRWLQSFCQATWKATSLSEAQSKEGVVASASCNTTPPATLATGFGRPDARVFVKEAPATPLKSCGAGQKGSGQGHALCDYSLKTAPLRHVSKEVGLFPGKWNEGTGDKIVK